MLLLVLLSLTAKVMVLDSKNAMPFLLQQGGMVLWVVQQGMVLDQLPRVFGLVAMCVSKQKMMAPKILLCVVFMPWYFDR